MLYPLNHRINNVPLRVRLELFKTDKAKEAKQKEITLNRVTVVKSLETPNRPIHSAFDGLLPAFTMPIDVDTVDILETADTGSLAELGLSSRRAGNPLPGRRHHQRTDILENQKANRLMNRASFRARCNETAWAYLLDTKDLDRSSLKRYAKVTTLGDVRRQIRKHINRLESYFSYDVDNGRWMVKPPIGLFDRALVLYGRMKSHRRAVTR